MYVHYVSTLQQGHSQMLGNFSDIVGFESVIFEVEGNFSKKKNIISAKFW